MHLFCAGCKIFQETPSLLRWETARGSKRTAGNNPACPPLPFRNPNRFGSIGPPQHYEISSRHGSLGLPQHLEISSRLSGASALQSRGAFSRPQAHSFAYPRNAEESLAQAQLGVLTPPCSDTGRGRAVPWPSGPKFFPQGWDSEHSHRARDPRGTLEVLPACVPAAGGQGRSPPPEPNQGVAPTPARASTSPCQRLLEKLTEQQKGRALRGRKRKAPKGLLWASTRRRRAAHRERQLQLSNSLFWLSWQPLRSEPLGHQEEVVPTPPSLLNAPEAQVSQGACRSPPRPSACTTKLMPRRRRVVVPSLTGRRPWALSPYSCPLSSPPSRSSSGIIFRAPSRRSFRFAGCKSTNAAARSMNSGSATAVLVALSRCLNASASTRRRWSGPSPPSLPPASSCSGCSSGPPCGAAQALPQRPALKNSASEPVLKPGSSKLLAEHALRGT